MTAIKFGFYLLGIGVASYLVTLLLLTIGFVLASLLLGRIREHKRNDNG